MCCWENVIKYWECKQLSNKEEETSNVHVTRGQRGIAYQNGH